MTRKTRWKPILLLCIIAALFTAAEYLGLGGRLQQLKDEIESYGPWAPLVFILIYIACTTAMIPGAALTVMAGGIFGSVWGVIYVNIAATTGAALCFAIARTFARKAVGDWLRENPHFHKLDEMTEAHGPAIVAVARLVPIFPYNVLNYGFGLTGVGFWTHLLLTWICMIPGTILYVVGADALVQWLENGSVPWSLVAVAGGLLVALLWLGAHVRKKWAEPTHEQSPDNP